MWVRNGANHIRRDGTTLLMKYFVHAYPPDLQCCETILKFSDKVDINHQDEYGQSAMTLAFKNTSTQKDVIQFLLENQSKICDKEKALKYFGDNQEMLKFCNEIQDNQK